MSFEVQKVRTTSHAQQSHVQQRSPQQSHAQQSHAPQSNVQSNQQSTADCNSSNKHVTFYYVRHGQTVYNRDGIIQGGTVDAPLSPEGLPTVQATAQALADIDFSHAYVSPLGRAQSTAQIILNAHVAAHPNVKIPLTTLQDLHEFDFGTFDGKHYMGRILRFMLFYFFQNFSLVGGETGREVKTRVRRAFAQMYAQAQDGDTVLIVAHGALFRFVMLLFYPAPWLVKKAMGETMKTPNAGIARIEGTPQGFTLVQLPQTAAEYRASAAHKNAATSTPCTPREH